MYAITAAKQSVRERNNEAHINLVHIKFTELYPESLPTSRKAMIILFSMSNMFGMEIQSKENEVLWDVVLTEAIRREP